jgi:hypothetical protein
MKKISHLYVLLNGLRSVSTVSFLYSHIEGEGDCCFEFKFTASITFNGLQEFPLSRHPPLRPRPKTAEALAQK